MIFNGIDYTRPIIGNGTGNGPAVFNDAFEPGVGDIDALAFFASLDNAALAAAMICSSSEPSVI